MGGCILDKLLAFTWMICYFECHGTWPWHAVSMHAAKSNLRCQCMKGHVEICVALAQKAPATHQRVSHVVAKM